MFFPIERAIRKKLNAYQAAANTTDGRDDGFFLEDNIFWGESIGSKSSIARGFFFEPLTRHDTPVDALLKDRGNWQTFIRDLATEEILQLHLLMSGDYSRAQRHYERETERETNPWVKRVRTERQRRVARQVLRRELVKPSFYGFLARPLDSMKDTQFANIFRAEAKLLDQRINSLSSTSGDIPVRLMNDEQHRMFFNRLMNPMYSEDELARQPPVNPYKSIFEQTVASPFLGGNLPASKRGEIGPAAFHFGGYFHGYVVVTDIPQGKVSHPLVLAPIVECGVKNLHAVATIQRRDTGKKLAELKKEIGKLDNTLEPYDQNGKPKNLPREVVMKAEKDRAGLIARQAELMGKVVRPFDMTLTVRTWARTPEDLEVQLRIIRGALESFDGLQTVTVQNKVSAEKFFFQDLGGNVHAYGHWRRDWNMYLESSYLPDFLPLFGTFLGNAPESPQILLDGAQNNLVGVDLFKGGVPQNALFIGDTRSGKSATVAEILSQIATLGFIGILDDGNTHGGFVKALGGQSIIVHPNGGQCFNYFDTFNQILTPEHILGQIALIGEMGAKDVAGGRARVDSILNTYIQYCYETRVSDLLHRDPARQGRLEREACFFFRFLKERQMADPERGEDDIFAEFKELRDAKDADLNLKMAAITERDVALFVQERSNNKFIIRFAVSDLSRTEALQHGVIAQTMRARPKLIPGVNPETVADIAGVMESFSAGGPNGTLFDGVANIDITGKIVQFELGRISDNAKTLKSTVQHLVFTFLRARVVNMSRAIRKVIVIEELSKVLKTEIGPAAYNELLAQMPKFNCQVSGVLQDLAQLDDGAKSKDGVTADSVLAKQKAYFILRQSNPPLMRRLAETIGLPKSCVSTVLAFKAPDQFDPGSAYSSVLFFQKSSGRPLVGVCRVRPNPELMFVAASNGDQYARRMELLAPYKDMLTGVIAEARKERPYLYPKQFALDDEIAA